MAMGWCHRCSPPTKITSLDTRRVDPKTGRLKVDPKLRKWVHLEAVPFEHNAEPISSGQESLIRQAELAFRSRRDG